MVYYKKWLKSLNFTLDEKIEFVNNIRQRPAIWDRRKRDSLRDKYEVTKCWEEIMDIFVGKELSHEEREELLKAIQKKWRSMRDNYLKYYKNIKKYGKHSDVKFRRSRFFESDLFTFLDVTFDNHPTETNEEEKEEKKDEKKEEEDRMKGKGEDSKDIVSDLEEVEIGDEVDDDVVTQGYVDDISNKVKETNVEGEGDSNEGDSKEGGAKEGNSNNEVSSVTNDDDDDDDASPGKTYVGPRYLDDIRNKLRNKNVEGKGDAKEGNSNSVLFKYSSAADKKEKEKDYVAGKDNKKLNSVTKACAEDVETRNDRKKLDSVTCKEGTRKRLRENDVQEEERVVEKGNDNNCTTDESASKRMKGNVEKDDSIVNNHDNYSFDIVVVENHHSTENRGVKESPQVPYRNRLLRKTLTKVELDECDVFGKLVAIKLRKMDSSSRTRLQSIIFQTLFNAEQQQR
ncbi:hypothetical protein LSTR_LSTR005662 [Laodelphax striatellus]|uniref:MADF domain-containing protein n=1 Tax=Laodelphax striatellus TaxID=195883 RepID=A0A482X7Y3_LAOST|nr:hypothetical protein LSTR_LSTR005662 [Laodelphax striatellus]